MGKIQKFKREIRSVNGKILAFDLKNGYGAAVGGFYERIARGRVTDAEVHEMFGMDDDAGPEVARIQAGPQIVPSSKAGKFTAIVSAHGTALYDFEWQPYAFSTKLLAETMDRLANDPTIDTILLDMNSPGGHVTGTMEAGDAVYRARRKKQVIGLVNPLCASAMYWIGSQCSKLVSVPSGDIGSIGVFMAHYDCSKMMDDIGVKVTFIYAGENKTEGNSMEPLAESAREFYQSEVDQTYSDFIAAVARGRGIKADVVIEKFGKGRCYTAQVAKKLGMIDEIGTISSTLASIGLTQMPMETGGRRGEVEAPAETAGAGEQQDQAEQVDETVGETVEEPVAAAMSSEGCAIITIRQDRVEDGSIKFYAVNQWSEKVAISSELIAAADGKLVGVAGDTVTMAAENGAAVYTKLGLTESGDWVCRLEAGSSWSEPPQSEADRKAEAERVRTRLAILAA